MKIWRVFALNLWLLAASFSSVKAEDSKSDVYVINTHIVIEDKYQEEHPEWGREVFDIIAEVNRQFANENLPVALKVKDINVVSADFNKPRMISLLELGKEPVIAPDKIYNALEYVHQKYYTQNYPANNEIVIVFIQQNKGFFNEWGMAYKANDPPPHVAVVARPQAKDCNSANKNCLPFLVHVTMHEVCHLFNAEDLKLPHSKKYLMYPSTAPASEPAFKIDKLNRAKILPALKIYKTQ